MIQSMTAFARKQIQSDWGMAIWELRSINHRYLELNVRLPDNFRELEAEIRERINKKLLRGKLECFLRYQPHAATSNFSVNLPLAQQLLQASQQLEPLLPGTQPIDILRLLEWPGILTVAENSTNQVQATLVEAFDQALDDLVESRKREGNALKLLIEEKIYIIQTLLTKLRQYLPVMMESHRARLMQRVQELKMEIDNGRFEQEMLFLLQKSEVTEELERLETHTTEVLRVLQQSGAMGRRLDFLMQELNREANTLGSKSVDAETTSTSVELKVLIEQMREQIQNIE
jgi:uncharacterized protein (TIGR00255 family)